MEAVSGQIGKDPEGGFLIQDLSDQAVFFLTEAKPFHGSRTGVYHIIALLIPVEHAQGGSIFPVRLGIGFLCASGRENENILYKFFIIYKELFSG